MLCRKKLAELLASELRVAEVHEAMPQKALHDLNPDLELEFEEFRAKYQLYNLNRKEEAEGGVPDWQREEAWTAFKGLQASSRAFNERFRPTAVLERARQIIHDLLPCFHYIREDLWAMCNFGPGTFNGAKEPLSYSTHYKIGGIQTVSSSAKDLALKVILEFFPNWAKTLKATRCITVRGNRPSFVVKDVRKCRPIAIEPSLNVFLQQGVGRWLGHYMKQQNFADIHDGQAVNRRLAGSLKNGTIDLSSASDTINTELVRFLLPSDWFLVLDTIRSKHWTYRAETGSYENFSSQGNAFTFPLETLIFKAIVMAYTNLSKWEVTVYGDDIIVPVEKALVAVYGLERSGFSVNTEKSYYGQHDDIRKYFRESCGADYYMERLVTPVYYRANASHDSDLAVLYNRLYEEWPNAVETQNYVLNACRKKPLVGPRFFISDDPSWVETDAKFKKLRFNTVCSSYSSFFWSEGILEDAPHYGKAYSSRARELTDKDFISPDVTLLTILLKGGNFFPSNLKPRMRVQRVAYTATSEGVELKEVGLLKACHLTRRRVFLS